jgi:hypothetical protein
MVANNADAPAFATQVNASLTPTTVNGHITIPGQTPMGGMEQSVWDPHTGTFFVSIPSFNGSDAGGIAEIDTHGHVVASGTINFTSLGIASCSPAGLALGGSGNLMVGCNNAGTQTLIVNPTTGTIVAQNKSVSGTDELWYDPVTGNFYVTGVNAAGDRVIDVINDTIYSVLQSIDLTALGVASGLNAHSVAVNPRDGDIFVPLPGTTSAGTNTLCPLGCVAVFSTPEPGSLPLLAVGLAGVIGFAVRRRLQ